MILNQRVIEQCNAKTKEKIEFWNRHMPQIQFDENGRSKIAILPKITEELVNDYIYNYSISDKFEMLFHEYLQENESYYKNCDDNYKCRIYNTYDIPLNSYIDNILHLKKYTTEKKTQIKLSKVLSHIQDKWLAYYPDYNLIIDRIKELRSNDNNYNNCNELIHLNERKESLEQGNLYFMYQRLLNTNNGTNYMYLSINPLDLLTSSGENSDWVLNPTRFHTCWSLTFNKHDDSDYYTIDREGCYSNAESIIAIGKIINRAIAYIPNNKTLKINDNIELYGYKKRSHVWLDSNGLFIERIYPDKSDAARQQFIKLIENNNIPIVHEKDITEYMLFDIQDYAGIKNYINVAENNGYPVFLDREAINNNLELVYLKQDRIEYSYNSGDRMPEENKIYCENCNCTIDEEDAVYIDDRYLCNECLRELYRRCEDCGEYVLRDNLTDVGNNRYYYVCNNCLDNYQLCYNCGTWTATDNIYIAESGDAYCDECYHDIFYHCDNCDREILRSDGIPYNHNNYCQECYEEMAQNDTEEEEM
jgi:hypothetical protein